MTGKVVRLAASLALNAARRHATKAYNVTDLTADERVGAVLSDTYKPCAGRLTTEVPISEIVARCDALCRPCEDRIHTATKDGCAVYRATKSPSTSLFASAEAASAFCVLVVCRRQGARTEVTVCARYFDPATRKLDVGTFYRSLATAKTKAAAAAVDRTATLHPVSLSAS